jgi:putative hydrolase of the HAD superfamily
MPLRPERIEVVVFDYGNTLVEFAAPQIRACDGALVALLERRFGPVDFERLHALRNEDRRAPYRAPEYRENLLPELCARLVARLYGRAPSPLDIEEMLRCRFESFVEAVRAEPHVPAVLAEIGRRRRLALLSNYPDGEAIRASLRRTGLAPFFEAVVVSADVGRVKPHPAVFGEVARRLALAPGAAVLVGDNWLADIQGARRAGWQAVLTRQWDTPEVFDREPGHEDADAEIRHLSELPALLA